MVELLLSPAGNADSCNMAKRLDCLTWAILGASFACCGYLLLTAGHPVPPKLGEPALGCLAYCLVASTI
jgi:hypothetical protein